MRKLNRLSLAVESVDCIKLRDQALSEGQLEHHPAPVSFLDLAVALKPLSAFSYNLGQVILSEHLRVTFSGLSLKGLTEAL